MSTTYTPATTRFLTGPHCLRNACDYVSERHANATELRRVMPFMLFTDGVMRCEIYDHAIHLNVTDNAGVPAGTGRIYPSGHRTSIPFTRIEQALAYILASNW